MCSIRVTGQAGIAIVLIPGNLIMVIICLVFLVTGDTSENGIIIWVSVTIVALIPFPFMLAAVNREIEIIVIPG